VKLGTMTSKIPTVAAFDGPMERLGEEVIGLKG
jgi:hypothetical protein